MSHTEIGSSIVIEGEIIGDEDLIVRGTVKGKIQLKENLIIEDSAVVHADIETGTIKISGQVTGNVLATERVELLTNSQMVGDVKCPRIQIAEGATFKGSVDMEVEG